MIPWINGGKMEIGHYLKHAYIPCKSLLCSKSGKERILKQLGSFSCLGRRKQLYLFRFTALFTQVTKRKNGCCLIRYPELDFSFFLYIYMTIFKKEEEKRNREKDNCHRRFLLIYNSSRHRVVHLLQSCLQLVLELL